MFVGREGRLRPSRAGDEELPRLRPFEHRHRVDLLTLDPQALATCHEKVGVGAFGEDGRDVGSRLDHVLEVVEEEQQASAVDNLRQRPATAERPGSGRPDVRRFRERRERHPPDAVGVCLGSIAGRLKREPRLPGTSRPRESEEARVVAPEQLANLGELVVAAEKLRGGDRQVRAIERLERCEVGGADLVDPFRRAQVLEPVLAEVA